MECYDQSLLFILAGLGSDPFSSGKPCSANSDCNTALGVTCCGVNTTYGRCCPDSLCITNCKASDSTTFDYCGSVCPDYPKTTQSTPSYLSTTKSTTTTATTTTASNATMDYEDEDEDKD